MDYKIHEGKSYVPHFEYFCFGCGQLRLSYVDLDKCGNCESKNIKKAPIGTLNKEKLKDEFNSPTNPSPAPERA